MNFTKRLFKHKNPYDINSTDGLFFKAVKENCEFHYNNNPEYPLRRYVRIVNVECASV